MQAQAAAGEGLGLGVHEALLIMSL
jgi:hypothetical protein